jgi:hypothetical protein
VVAPVSAAESRIAAPLVLLRGRVLIWTGWLGIATCASPGGHVRTYARDALAELGSQCHPDYCVRTGMGPVEVASACRLWGSMMACW